MVFEKLLESESRRKWWPKWWPTIAGQRLAKGAGCCVAFRRKKKKEIMKGERKVMMINWS